MELELICLEFRLDGNLATAYYIYVYVVAMVPSRRNCKQITSISVKFRPIRIQFRQDGYFRKVTIFLGHESGTL
jgi:hypothetical protein